MAFRLFVAALPLLVVHSQAQVASYSLFKVARFHQTGAAAPRAPDFPNAYTFGARLFTEQPDEVKHATVRTPSANLHNLIDSSPVSLDYAGGGFFASKSNLDFAFPSGDYVFGINNSSESASLTIPTAELYTTTIPAFAASEWSSMQSVNAGKPFALKWNGFKPHPSADRAFTFVRIFDEATGDSQFTASLLDPNATGCTIPAGVLKPSARYRVELVFSNRAERQKAGFRQALAVTGFDYLTYALLVTLPSSSIPAASGNPTWLVEGTTRPGILIDDGSFGFRSNRFGFNLRSRAGQVVVIDGSTDLMTWTPLATNTVSSGSLFFSDPSSIELARRFYRVRFQ